MTQINLEEKRVISAYNSRLSSLWGSCSRYSNQPDLSHRQSRAGRNGFSCTHLLVPMSISAFVPFRTPCLGKSVTHRGPGLPTPAKTRLHKQVHSPTQGRQSLTECLFPGGFKLRNVDKVNCLIPPLKVVSDNLEKCHRCPLKSDLLKPSYA